MGVFPKERAAVRAVGIATLRVSLLSTRAQNQKAKRERDPSTKIKLNAKRTSR
jgi:hypothetical protein